MMRLFEKQNTAFIIRHKRKILGMLGALFVGIAITVSMNVKVTAGYEPVLLLPILDTLVIGILGIIASFIAAKIYASTKMISVLIMGCGILAFALGATSSGWLRYLPDGTNINVTVYNTSAMLGSVLHIAGAVFGFRTGRNKIANPRNVKFSIIFAYSCVFLLIATLALTSMQGLLPRFFIQGTGPTLLRQNVLWTAVILYLSTAVIFFSLYVKSKFDYLFWYSFSMGMIALGLYVATTIQVVGGPASWAGRLAVFVGSTYTFIAILVLVRIARMNEISMGKVVTNFFIDSETNYKNLTESLSDAIISVDQHFIVFFANTAAEKMFGYNKIQIIGSNFLESIVPEQYKDLISHGRQSHPEEDAMERIGITEPIPDKIIEMEIKTRDGRFIPVELSVTIRKIKTGRIRTYIIRDITERKRAETAVKLSEELFRTIFDQAPIGIALIDSRTAGIHKANNKFTMISGRPIVGTNCVDWNDMTHPDDIQEVSGKMQLMNSNQIKEFNMNYRLVRPDGSIAWIRASMTAISTEYNGHQQTLCMIEDITEREKAELQIQQFNETLQLRVHERTEQLENAIKELESFSYSVSHDLRAPLRHMMGFVELLNKNSHEMVDEKSTHYLSVISGSAYKMSQLIDDLLLFSRMGRIEMMNTRVDVYALALEVINNLKPETEGRNMEWNIQTIPDAKGDRNMLFLVLTNLFSNAVKFTRPKMVAKIEFGITPDNLGNAQPVYYIRDNGVGFDMRYADKLFGIFQRLHRQEEFEGTGVGLANVERILHRHGCRIWAEGIPDHGATFYFTLPKWEEVSP